MKRFVPLVLASALALSGCPLDNLPSETDPPPSGPLTPEQRIAALDAADLLISALPGLNFEEETNALVSFLRSRSEFALVGAAPGGIVWAMFTDGTLFFVIHGLPTDSTPAPAQGAGALAVPPPAVRAATANVDVGELPGSKRFRLLNGLGFGHQHDPSSTIKGMLESGGYVGVSETATLDALRAVKDDGVFYFRTHGGAASFQRDSTSYDLYALWTASPALNAAQESADATLQEDLKAQRVVYMRFRNTNWTRGLTFLPENRHYGITDRFIAHYMSFAENSLIYLDACDGATHPGLRGAFRNASVFAGWNGLARFDAIERTAKFVFDRLLGANQFEAENPAQRPFPYPTLQHDPRFGKGKRYGYSHAVEEGRTFEAELDFYPLRGSFGMLAPSIFVLMMDDESDLLNLLGSFGSRPSSDATVTISSGSDELALVVEQWEPGHILAYLPRKGSGSSGDVMVTVRGHRSNPRRLIKWDGKLIYTLEEAGTLFQSVEMDLFGRFDPDSVRMLPGTRPQAWQGTFAAAKDAAARYSTGGSHTDRSTCTYTTEWSGSGSIPAGVRADEAYVHSAMIETPRRQLNLNLGFAKRDGFTATTTLACPNSDPIKVPVASTLEPPHDPMWEVPFFQLRLDPQLNLIADQRSGSPDSRVGTGGKAKATLRWDMIRAQPAYNPRQPR